MGDPYLLGSLMSSGSEGSAAPSQQPPPHHYYHPQGPLGSQQLMEGQWGGDIEEMATMFDFLEGEHQFIEDLCLLNYQGEPGASMTPNHHLPSAM